MGLSVSPVVLQGIMEGGGPANDRAAQGIDRAIDTALRGQQTQSAIALQQQQAAAEGARAQSEAALTAGQLLKNQQDQLILQDQQTQRDAMRAVLDEARANPPAPGSPASLWGIDPLAYSRKLIEMGALPTTISAAQNAGFTQSQNAYKLNADQNAALVQHHKMIQAPLEGYAQQAGDPNVKSSQLADAWPATLQAIDAIDHPYAVKLANSFGANAAPTVEQINPVLLSLANEGYAAERAKNLAEIGLKGAQQKEAEANEAAKRQETAVAAHHQALQDLSAVQSQDEYDSWRKKYPDEKAPPMYSPSFVSKTVQSAVPIKDQPKYQIDLNKAQMGVMGDSDFETFFLPAYAKSLGKTSIADLTPDERMKAFGAFKEANADPESRALMIAQKNFAIAMQKYQLEQMPTKEDAAWMADDIVNHRLAPEQLSQIRGRGNGQLGLMVTREIKKINPSFNWEEASAEYNLSKSPGFQQTVRYMDYVGSSVDNVIKAADALANGKVRSINALINAGKDQFNSVNLAKFNADRLEVADAIAKILQGGGTGSGTSDKKLEQAQGLIRGTDDPEVVRATLGEVKGLIANRRATLTKGTFMENAAPQPGDELPAAARAQLKEGQNTTFRNGQVWTLKNGQPTQVK